MRKRVLLGIDFVGFNYNNSFRSIKEWWSYVKQSSAYECLLGVSHFCFNNKVLPGSEDKTPRDVIKELKQFIPIEQMIQWTSDIDSEVIGKLENNNIHSQPLFTEFNYGSVNNRLLLLAHSHECDYLVRVDPGTIPPKLNSFSELMKEHEEKIDNDPYTIISRRYSERFALRNMFVKSGLEKLHLKLVQKFTGIDVFNQVTGGAMLTFKTPGTPAICFPAKEGFTLVWGSDDGLYQVIPETRLKSHMLPDNPVERFDSEGKPKSSKEYYRGIIGAVFLKFLKVGKDSEFAKDRLELFFKDLKDNILDSKLCQELDNDKNWHSSFSLDNIVTNSFFDSIEKGYKNYLILIDEWLIVCDLLKSILVEKIKVNRI